MRQSPSSLPAPKPVSAQAHAVSLRGRTLSGRFRENIKGRELFGAADRGRELGGEGEPGFELLELALSMALRPRSAIARAALCWAVKLAESKFYTAGNDGDGTNRESDEVIHPPTTRACCRC